MLKTGDLIIAADGRVFPGVLPFSDHVGLVPPGGRIEFDTIPAGGGTKDAQRIEVIVGGSGAGEKTPGFSTGTKLAIGVGAAALFGCYELGCFARHKPAPAASSQPPSAAPRP